MLSCCAAGGVGEAARGGASAMKPFLQNLWSTRAVAYRDAVQQFIAGYKEGFQEANKPDIPSDVAQEMHQQPPKEDAGMQSQTADTAVAVTAPREGQQQQQPQQQGQPPPHTGSLH